MNTNEKYLYEEFTDINLKYRHGIFDFINRYCPIVPIIKNKALCEKIKNFKSRNNSDIIKKREEILKNLKLYDYSKAMVSNGCKRCQMCQYETFKKVKKMLFEIQDDIFNKNIYAEKALNYFIRDVGYFNFWIIQDFPDNFTLQKGDTLKQKIYFNFIENISEKLNNFYNKKNEYFVQIAKLLLVNNKFLKDLNNIKDRYFYLRDVMYYPKKEYKEFFPRFQNELLKLRNNYNLAQRWEPYILQGMLIYPIDDGELITPKDQPAPKPPTGEPGRMQSFIGKKKLPEELILVGDEKENTVKAYTKKHNIKNKGYYRTKDYKTPLRNFDRDFRWYKAYQYSLKDKNIINKDSIFLDIFFNDIYKYPKDWQEPDYVQFRDEPDGLSVVLKDDIEIKGISKIRTIIYRLDRIVYKKEK